ncbi:Ttll10 [Columba guinea]|nr:Ttll10 [Columba guinea]
MGGHPGRVKVTQGSQGLELIPGIVIHQENPENVLEGHSVPGEQCQGIHINSATLEDRGPTWRGRIAAKFHPPLTFSFAFRPGRDGFCANQEERGHPIHDATRGWILLSCQSYGFYGEDPRSSEVSQFPILQLLVPALKWILTEPSLVRTEQMVRHVLKKNSQKKRHKKHQWDQDHIFILVDPMELSCKVSIYCQSRGWQRIYDDRREDYALKWCETKCRKTYCRFKEGEQLLYQIPNNGVLTSKIGLLCCLREQERTTKKISRSSNAKLLKMEEFFPESFRLDLKDERNAFFGLCKEEQIWICKPSCSNQGRGIFLLKNEAAVHTLQAKLLSTEEHLLSKKMPYKVPQARIVQRYIHQPLLLEGKKFDVRSFLLIACTAPYVLFFAQGYVRLTCVSYDAASDDLTVHLTNQYMQKKNSLYSQLKDETVWRMEHFNSYVNEKFGKNGGLPKDWVFTVFTKRMQQIMLQCFLAAKHKLDRKLGYFDLIGCDFLIDENFKVWLLEMNANPALHTGCRALSDTIPAVVHESLGNGQQQKSRHCIARQRQDSAFYQL